MTIVKKSAKRIYSPFVLPEGASSALRVSELRVAETRLGDRDDLRLGTPPSVPPEFAVQVSGSAVAAICDAWNIKESDLLVVAMMEVEFLKEIQVEKKAPSRSADLTWKVPLSARVTDALGRSDVTFSAYLVLGQPRKPNHPGEPFQKGHIIARWRTQLQAPSQTFRFKPRLLNEENRQYLEERFGRKISASTTLLVYTDGLLGEGDLDDCLEVYIHPDVADHLDSVRAVEAKATEGMILWAVVEEILRGVRDEAKDLPSHGIPQGAPVRSLLVSLQEAAGLESLEDMIAIICEDPRSYAAIATYAQEIAGLLEAAT